VDYETDAQRVQKDIYKAGPYNPNRKAELAQMKKELQRTSFSFGHDVSRSPCLSSNSRKCVIFPICVR
jgi:hypothetical protein